MHLSIQHPDPREEVDEAAAGDGLRKAPKLSNTAAGPKLKNVHVTKSSEPGER